MQDARAVRELTSFFGFLLFRGACCPGLPCLTLEFMPEVEASRAAVRGRHMNESSKDAAEGREGASERAQEGGKRARERGNQDG
jgi:hypothetical protein